MLILNLRVDDKGNPPKAEEDKTMQDSFLKLFSGSASCFCQTGCDFFIKPSTICLDLFDMRGKASILLW